MHLRFVNCPRRHSQHLAIEDTIYFHLAFDHHTGHLQTCPEHTLLYLISMLLLWTIFIHRSPLMMFVKQQVTKE